MPRVHRPRRGSLAYSPRKRAARIYPRVRSKSKSTELKISEFGGYKVGMTTILMINDKKGTVTQNQEISVPVTILETPPLKVVAIRAYKKTPYGLKVYKDVFTAKLDNTLERKLILPKKINAKIEDIEKELGKLFDIRLLVHSQPVKSAMGKKKQEFFEIGLGGPSLEEKLKLAKEKLGGEINIKDVFKEGEFIDTIGVSVGKGFQGSVKRWGVKRLSHKAQKLRRKAGNLGPWHPHKTRWTVPQMGQMGFHTRTEYNKRVLKISEKLENKAGWKKYGVIKGDYILLKGSVIGHTKRFIRLRKAIRTPSSKYGTPQIEYISVR